MKTEQEIKDMMERIEAKFQEAKLESFKDGQPNTAKLTLCVCFARALGWVLGMSEGDLL